jgi:hypothetical protein
LIVDLDDFADRVGLPEKRTGQRFREHQRIGFPQARPDAPQHPQGEQSGPSGSR